MTARVEGLRRLSLPRRKGMVARVAGFVFTVLIADGIRRRLTVGALGGWGSSKVDEVFINALLQPVAWHSLLSYEVEKDRARRNAVLSLIDGADVDAVQKSVLWTF